MEATPSFARTGISPCAAAFTALSHPARRLALRTLAFTLALFALLAAASAQSAPACVTQPFTPAPLMNNFEGADGDQCDSDGAGPKRDWQNVIGEDGFVGTADAPSGADTIYGSNNAGIVAGPTSENVPDSWNFTIGNLGGSKFDALAAYSFTDPVSDKLFVDLAFVRAAATGATFLAFELNQRQPGYRMDPNESDPTKPFAVPTRSRGDLLVTYDVNNAGAITLGLCIWDGNEHSGQWEEFAADLTGAPITNQPCPQISTSLYQAALNDAQAGRQGTIPAAENFLSSGDIGQGRFGEAVVNLSDALRDPANPTGPQACIDFGYVWMHTRSSDSLTSNQQDVILPTDAVSIGNCSVEGKKFNDADGDGVDDGAANGEPGLGGWTIFVDYDGDGILDNNKDATFVNDMDGIVEAGEEEPYAITADGTGTEPLGHYRITDVQRATNAPGGTWEVREVLQPTWDCTAAIGAGAVATCPEKTDTDPDTALGFRLSWDNNDIHTGRDFGNKRQPATLKVVKHVVNDNGGTAVAGDWSLHVKSGATDVPGSPQAGDENGDTYTLTPGASYDVSETGGPSGYAATFSGDCDSSGSVTVAAGVQKTCTITNDDVAPKVKVVKHVVNDDGGTAVAGDWSLHLKNDAGADVAGSPQAGDENGDTYTVAAGDYEVSETGGPSGYTATFSGDCDADGDVSVAVGVQKTCTITNDDIAPRLTVVKHVVNRGGSNTLASAFQMDVTATNPSDAHFPGSERGTTITLDAGPYAVDESGGPSTFEKALSADCAGTIAVGQEKTCTITNTKVLPAGIVVKKGPAWAYHGDTLNFTFEVTNPGTTPLTTVNVTDDKCAPVVGPTQKLGGDQDDKLDAGETWVYTCTMQVPAHTAGDTSLVNTVTLSASDADGEPVGDSDQHTTLILHPAINVDKAGPATAQAGQPVAYTIVVTNPGDVPFLAQNVNVADALCEAPPLLTTKNGDPTPGQFDPGDTWTYTCTVQTLVGQTVVNNVAVATATDSFGGNEVGDDDAAATQLTQPPVAPPPPPPPPRPSPAPVAAASVPVAPSSAPASIATARLSGPGRCVSRSFKAAVRGRNISQVLFILDGKKLRTVKSRPGRTVFSVRIDPRRQSYRAHRVIALVSFRASANRRPRTLRMVYVRCARVMPKFTG